MNANFIFLVIFILQDLISFVIFLYMVHSEREHRRERNDLMKAIMAKNLTDLTSSTIIEKETTAKGDDELGSNVVEETELTDEGFSKIVKKLNEAQNGADNESTNEI